MIACLRLVTYFLISLLKSRGRLEAEVVVLRHQLNVLRRTAPSQLRFTSMDRLIFVWLYRLCPSLLNAVGIIKPATVLRWHRGGFRLYWRWKSRSPGGRPKISRETRQLRGFFFLGRPYWPIMPLARLPPIFPGNQDTRVFPNLGCRAPPSECVAMRPIAMLYRREWFLLASYGAVLAFS
jgi:hypothetical protein